MERKLFGIFSGGQVTAILIAAIVTPGAVYAVAATAVAITDPVSGRQAAVDAGRRLYTLDPIAFYKNNPGNQREIYISNGGNQCETTYQYTVPAGSAFIITSISGYEYQYNSATSYSGVSLFAALNCVGNSLTTHLSSVSSAAPVAPVVAEYGVGIPVPAGSTIIARSTNNFGYTYIHGYLVPASTVPANPSPTAATASAAELAGKLNRSP